MMCAATAAARGNRVLVIEHADQPGKKILISGGGRCNFTNLETTPERFLSENPHFAKSALKRYRPEDFIALLADHQISWHEKTLGQLFCDGSARQIVEMLQSECAKAGAGFALGTATREIAHRDGAFEIETSTGQKHRARSLVIATGGPSIPKIGATGLAYDIARQFGLDIVPPRPGLVPLKLSGSEQDFGKLTGIAAEVIARTGAKSFREAALFTHRGLSGPAILQISSYWKTADPVFLNFAPGSKEGWLVEAKHARPKSTLATALSHVLSNRLAQILAEKLIGKHGLGASMANVPDRQLRELEAELCNWQFNPTGTEGFAKAEVTIGGVSTTELSSKSMQAKKVPGLYFIGEAVDVTGWLGGYNFQWAWASGWACGQAL